MENVFPDTKASIVSFDRVYPNKMGNPGVANMGFILC